MKIEMLEDQVREMRRALHQIPEIGFDLPVTSAYVKERLMEFGYDPISVARTGWVAVLPGEEEGAIAFRADMDALMVTEETGAPYASLYPGRMHACGHDGHMALLLGFARYMKEKPKPRKTLVFVFQPAEEGPGGAQVVMESGLLQSLKVERIYGYHLFPGLPEGILGLAEGPLMAQNGEFNIHIEGTSAHGAQPHMGADALLAATQVVTQIQAVISRRLDPLEPAVVNVGTIQAGSARNIVAGRATLEGTIRSFSEETYLRIKEELHRLCAGVMQISGTTIRLEIDDFYPAVLNDADLFQGVQDLLSSEEYALLRPMMLAEDFAFYQQEIPGLFMMLGTGNAEKGWRHPLHSCYFDFEERVLLKGIELYERILKAEDILPSEEAAPLPVEEFPLGGD